MGAIGRDLQEKEIHSHGSLDSFESGCEGREAILFWWRKHKHDNFIRTIFASIEILTFLDVGDDGEQVLFGFPGKAELKDLKESARNN